MAIFFKNIKKLKLLPGDMCQAVMDAYEIKQLSEMNSAMRAEIRKTFGISRSKLIRYQTTLRTTIGIGMTALIWFS